MKYYITPLAKRTGEAVKRLRYLAGANKVTVPHRDKKGYAYWLEEDIPKLIEELSALNSLSVTTVKINMFKELCNVLYATPEYFLDYKQHTDLSDVLASKAVQQMLDEVLETDEQTKQKLVNLCTLLTKT